MMTGTRAVACAFVLFVTACASKGRPPDGPPDGPPLRIVPDMVTLQVSDGVPLMQSYEVQARNDDGTYRDVTGDSMIVIGNPDLGTMSGGDLTTSSTHGGHTILTATWKAQLATSDLTVLLTKVVVDPGAPSDAPDQFGTA